MSFSGYATPYRNVLAYIFFIFKNVINKIDFDSNKKEFLINDITNFNWNHVKIYIVNSDFQKIVFYYKFKIV